MGVLSIRLTQDEELLLKNAAAAEKVPISELARRRIFSEKIAGELATLRAENEAVINTLADVIRHLRFVEGLNAHILRHLEPEEAKDIFAKIKAKVFEEGD